MRGLLSLISGHQVSPVQDISRDNDLVAHVHGLKALHVPVSRSTLVQYLVCLEHA